MTPMELASRLDGKEYPLIVSNELRAEMRAAKLVIVYGASDDLMELDGAIYEEIGVSDGGTISVDHLGFMPRFEDIDIRERGVREVLREYFRREGGGKSITALWCKEGGYSWTYRTDIPHETFDLMEDGEPYCRGIVFAMADL